MGEARRGDKKGDSPFYYFWRVESETELSVAPGLITGGGFFFFDFILDIIQTKEKFFNHFLEMQKSPSDLVLTLLSTFQLLQSENKSFSCHVIFFVVVMTGPKD